MNQNSDTLAVGVSKNHAGGHDVTVNGKPEAWARMQDTAFALADILRDGKRLA